MATSRLALLESRLSALEAELTQLKQQQVKQDPQNGKPGDDWIDKIYGAFADYPDYDKVIELGRKYRESLRPKKKSKKAAKGRRK